MAEIFNLAWTIWKRRNTRVFEGPLWDFETTLTKAAHIHIGEGQKKEEFFQDISPTTWAPPRAGEYRLNVDAAIGQSGTGFGAIIRNEKGETMAAATRLWCAQDDPTMAEAMIGQDRLASHTSP